MKKRTVHKKPRSSTPSSQHVHERELVLQWKQGKNNAFRTLYTHFHGWVFGIIMRIVRNTAIAEEATQETFLLVHLHAHQFEEGTNFRAWIFRIGTRKALKYVRRTHDSYDETYHSDQYGATSSAHPDPHIALEYKECRQIIEEELEHLYPEFKEAMKLYAWEEKSHTEIADEVGAPIETIRTRLFRARKRLLEITKDKLRDYLNRSDS